MQLVFCFFVYLVLERNWCVSGDLVGSFPWPVPHSFPAAHQPLPLEVIQCSCISLHLSPWPFQWNWAIISHFLYSYPQEIIWKYNLEGWRQHAGPMNWKRFLWEADCHWLKIIFLQVYKHSQMKVFQTMLPSLFYIWYDVITNRDLSIKVSRLRFIQQT